MLDFSTAAAIAAAAAESTRPVLERWVAASSPTLDQHYMRDRSVAVQPPPPAPVTVAGACCCSTLRDLQYRIAASSR